MYQAVGNWRYSTVTWVSRYLIPIGIICLLSGLLWAPKSSTYHSFFYALIAAPTLLALCLRPSLIASVSRTPTTALFLAFSFWALLSLSWAEPSADISSLIKRPLYISLLFAGCCLAAIQSPTRLISHVKAAAIIVLPFIAYGLFEHLYTPDAPERLIGTGALDNPLLSSHVFGFFASFWIATALTLKGYRLALTLLAAALMLGALLATESRTALLAISASIAWITLCSSRRLALILLSVFAISALGLISLTPEVITSRGLSYRPELWSATLEVISKNIIWGQGYSTELQLSEIHPNRVFSEPHNFALHVWHDLGLVGLTLWLSMYATALWACWKWHKEPMFLVAGAVLVYGIGAGLTEGGSILPRPKEHWFVIWIPLALVAALWHSKKNSTCKP